MNLGNNIFNAFEVVNKTHENVSKLMDYCKITASEKGEYVLAVPKFLRWKSDGSYLAWNLTSTILLFQYKKDKELESEWRDGPVYGIEINLYNKDVLDQPMVTLARYDYDDIKSWSPGCSPANHYIFYDPLYYLDYQEKEDIYITEVNEEFGKKYWGLRRVKCIMVPLVEITQENAYEKIFGNFNRLRD